MTDEITPQERNEVRALLASALTPEPPMRLRATEVLERARRRSLWHRLFTGLGALVLAGGIGTGTVVVVSAGSGGTSADPSPDTTTTTSRTLMPLPSPEQLPPPPTRRLGEGPSATQQHAAELTTLLAKAYAEGGLLPEGMRLAAKQEGVPPLQVKVGSVDDSPAWSYWAESAVEGVYGRGTLQITVFAPGTNTVRPCMNPELLEGNWHRVPLVSCQVVQMPNGQPAQAAVYRQGGENGWLELELTALTPNGTLLEISVTNLDYTVPPPAMPPSAGWHPPAAQPDLPLNRDDLIRIATLAGLEY